MRKWGTRLRHSAWSLYSHIGGAATWAASPQVTVILTYYDPARLGDIEPQIRNILKCSFVERLIVSNHNPDFKIEDRITQKDTRLTCLNQETRRGCGYRWQIAQMFPAEYYIAID